MPRFSAAIYKIGINPVVDPPDHMLKAIFAAADKSKGPIAVCGKINGAEFTQTLVKYKGAWRLYVNGPMLKASGLKVGDVAEVDIEFDPKPRDVPVPGKLAAALLKDKEASRTFDSLSPSRRKEIARYIGSLKSEEAIDRNVEKIIAHLGGETIDHVLTRSKARSR